MLKRTILAISLGAALLAVFPARAAESWYAFVFNGITRQLVRIGLDGTQQGFDLGLGDNVFLGGQDLAFSPDGNRVAFCANRANAESPQGETTLVVRDLAAQTNVVNLPLGDNIGCRVTGQGFNADASHVAVGVVKYYPGSADMDTSGPAWRLLVVDTTSGQVAAELNADSPLVSSAGMFTDAALLPEVHAFDQQQIVFAEVPWGVGGAPEWRAFFWQIDQGTLEPDPGGHWGKSGLSALAATGELVWLENDPGLPAADPGGPIPAFNVVMLADKSGASRIIHHTGEWSLVNTAFIEGGARLAVLDLSAFNPDSPDQQESRWMGLSRDGSVSELASSSAFSQVAGAPGGYLMFELTFSEDFSQQSATLSYVSNGQPQPLWEGSGAGWEFAGTMPTPVADNLTPFPAAQP